MVIAAIIVGIFLTFLFLVTIHLGIEKGNDFDNGVAMGFILSLFLVVEIILIASIFGTPKPTAMDVYQSKTTLEYKVVDSVKIDSIVVFKDSIYGRKK